VAQADAISEADGLRVSVVREKWQGSDLLLAVLRRPLAPCWLVNKAKENPKAVQGILGHLRIQTTLDLYTDENLDEMITAQEEFLDAVGFESRSVQ
jgi:hypothetical protein